MPHPKVLIWPGGPTDAMPLIEAPIEPKSPPPDRRPARRSARRDQLEPEELLVLIDDLEGERSRARFREGVWIALIVHIVLFWLWAYAPQVLFHRPRLINPSEVLQKREQMQYLALPEDALKQLKPKHTDILSDKDRVAQTKNPSLDKKTLEQLQAMKRAGPPAPSAQPLPAAPQPQQPIQQAQSEPPPPTPQPRQDQQPLTPNPQSQLSAPRPSTKPSFNTPTASAGEMIRQAARNAARSGGQSGDFGQNAPAQHPGLGTGAEILSDTMGVDFGPYVQRVIYATERSWWPIIPEEARPPLNKQGVTGIEFVILPDGTVKGMTLKYPSGDVALDRAAWGGITGAAPFPPLPKEFKGPYLALRFAFLYNKRDLQ